MRKQYPAIDLAKFICAIIVLFYHFYSEWGSLPSPFDEALSLYAVAVALFMAVSGFLFFDKQKNIEERQERWFNTNKQVVRILKVYIIWSIPYLLYTISRWDFTNLSAEFILSQIQTWVFKSTFSTIWFMPSCAFGLLLAFLVEEYFPRWLGCVLSLLLYTIGALMMTYQFLGNRIAYWESIAYIVNQWLGGARGWLLFGFPLTYLGGLISRAKKRLSTITSGIGVVLSMGMLLGEALALRIIAHAHTGIDCCFSMILICVMAIMFLAELRIDTHAFFPTLRKMSIVIFMSQRLFLNVIPFYAPHIIKELIQRNANISALVMCIITIGFSWLVVTLSRRYKALACLF